MRGVFIEHEGKVYSATKPEALRILKQIAKGAGPAAVSASGMKEVGPISFSLTNTDPDTARKLFTDLQLA